MFGKKNRRELEPPPIANRPQSVEVLRVWAAHGEEQQVVLKTTWKDAGTWGLMLADVARHAANAYANEGYDKAETLARIFDFLTAELADPTDVPEEMP